MSNISQASKNLKKKLSFDDYSKPASQQASENVSQPEGVPAGQQDIISALQQASECDMPVSREASKSNTRPSRNTSKLASDQTSAPKIKATFYLSEDDNQALTDVFIKRLQARNKTDKSALIAEAISLLYKREMK